VSGTAAGAFTSYFSSLSLLHVVLPIYGLTLTSGALWTYFARPGARSLPAFLAYSLPWRRWVSASTKVDIALYLASKFSTKAVNAFSAIVCVVLATRAGHAAAPLLHLHASLPAGPLAVGLICLALLVFVDLGEYLSHLLQHRVPALWAFHKIHHSASFLTPLTTYRAHPVSTLLDGVFAGAFLAIPVCVASMIVKLSAAEFVAMSAAANLFASIVLLNGLQHTHFQVSFGPLDRIFISPQMHQVHHSPAKRHWGKNLGSRLSIWDWWFGTGYRLPRGEVLNFGIGAEEPHEHFSRVWWCFVGPLIECAGMARRVWARLRPNAQNAPQTGVLTTPTAS
jgi:sterol desaturase/sphingolipid hydroxylase (fatty acid hydroxylase superfamily)